MPDVGVIKANHVAVLQLVDGIKNSLQEIKSANQSMSSACKTYSSFVDEQGFTQAQNYVNASIDKVNEVEPAVDVVVKKLEAFADYLEKLSKEAQS